MNLSINGFTDRIPMHTKWKNGFCGGRLFTDIIDKIVQESNQFHLAIDLNRHFGTDTDL